MPAGTVSAAQQAPPVPCARATAAGPFNSPLSIETVGTYLLFELNNGQDAASPPGCLVTRTHTSGSCFQFSTARRCGRHRWRFCPRGDARRRRAQAGGAQTKACRCARYTWATLAPARDASQHRRLRHPVFPFFPVDPTQTRPRKRTRQRSTHDAAPRPDLSKDNSAATARSRNQNKRNPL